MQHVATYWGGRDALVSWLAAGYFASTKRIIMFKNGKEVDGIQKAGNVVNMLREKGDEQVSVDYGAHNITSAGDNGL